MVRVLDECKLWLGCGVSSGMLVLRVALDGYERSWWRGWGCREQLHACSRVEGDVVCAQRKRGFVRG